MANQRGDSVLPASSVAARTRGSSPVAATLFAMDTGSSHWRARRALELLDAGHAPWLGHAERIASTIADFAREDSPVSGRATPT